MTAYEVICKLCKEKIPLDLGDGNVLTVIDDPPPSDRWIRYAKRTWCGGTLHYEISRYYQDLTVKFHDERDHREKNNVFRKKLSEIVEIHKGVLSRPRHSRMDACQFEIQCVHEVHCSRDFESIKADIEDVLRDLFNILEPFLECSVPSLEKGDCEIASALGAYVPQDAMTARDVICYLGDKETSLDIGGGVVMQRMARESGEWVQYKYKKERFDGYVHYELCREKNEIEVVLHDERGGNCIDVLRKNLMALVNLSKKDCPLTYEDEAVATWCFSIRSGERVRCNRDLASVVSEIQEKMRYLYDSFEKTLDMADTHGVESLDVLEMGCLGLPDMQPIPVRAQYDDDVVSPSTVVGNVITWVSTVSELFGREQIMLSDGVTKMRPGRYVIPNYQRKYAWTSRQVSQLCRDLLRAHEENKTSSYHLGTIILHHEAGGDDFYVVDGQQRLRTISRLLSQCFFEEGKSEESVSLPRLAADQKFTDENQLMIYGILQEYGENEQNHIMETLRNGTLVCIAVSDINEAFQLFSTQNGRGKPLRPENLLKAFHFHEMGENEHCNDIDREWEGFNIQQTLHDGRLLSQLIGEHLYRIRCWVRGEFPKQQFSSEEIDSFKGVTIKNEDGVPLQNISLLRRMATSYMKAKALPMVAERSKDDRMNPFVSIDQPIVNGEDFFEYALAYANAYLRLFESEEFASKALQQFKNFYKEYCLYARSWRQGDRYARHIYQSLCLFCYDKFGECGLEKCMRELYCCAYYERATRARCFYSTCGSSYAIAAVRAMLASTSVPDLKDRMHEIARRIKSVSIREVTDGGKPEGIETVCSVFL